MMNDGTQKSLPYRLLCTHEYLGFPGSRDTKHPQKMALQYLFLCLYFPIHRDEEGPF
jgi:hypothetical protein